MDRERRSPLGLYTIGIAALFLAGFLLLVVFGAHSYRNTVAGQDRNMESRALLSYLSTTLKAYDTAGSVSLGQTETGEPVLTVADGDTGFALRIYRWEGRLVEDYAAAEARLRPEEAQTIGETGVFTVERNGDVLLITTDAGRVLSRVRTGEGAAK